MKSGMSARCKTISTPILGANLGANGPYDPGPSWTDTNRRSVRDLRGELV